MPMAPLCLPRVQKMNFPGVEWLLCMAHAPAQPVAPQAALAQHAVLAGCAPLVAPARPAVLAGHMMQKQNA